MTIEAKEKEKDSIYKPFIATIKGIKELSSTEKQFDIQIDDKETREAFNFKPGQFVELTVFGLGEAPFSIPSSPNNKDYFELCIRNVGNVSGALHKMKEGDKVGIRGPFGKGHFPYEEMKDNNVVIVAGGLGMAPVRSLIKYVLENRDDYKRVIIIYGSINPDYLLYKDELEEWQKRDDVEVRLTVDEPCEGWQGEVGVCTNLIPGIDCPVDESYVVVCGPPVMYKFVIKELEKKCFKPEKVFLSLERRMECGVGKCNHCHIGDKMTCVDGPVFSLWEIRNLKEAI